MATRILRASVFGLASTLLTACVTIQPPAALFQQQPQQPTPTQPQIQQQQAQPQPQPQPASKFVLAENATITDVKKTKKKGVVEVAVRRASGDLIRFTQSVVGPDLRIGQQALLTLSAEGEWRVVPVQPQQ